MKLDSEKIEAFARLAQDLNYSKAAKALGMSQPALSKKIARLEDEMGVTLFIRSKRQVELTPAGHELVNYWKSKESLDREFFSRMGGTEKIAGTIKIGSFSTITSTAVIPSLRELFEENRDLNLELMTREIGKLPQMLLGGIADIVLFDERINRENVESELIANETLVHVIPKTGDRDLPFIDTDINDKITFTYLRAQGMKSDIRRLFVDDIHSIISGVKSGIGQAVISEHLFDPSTMRKVAGKKKVLSPVYLCYLKRVYMPQLIARVIEDLRANLKKFV